MIFYILGLLIGLIVKTILFLCVIVIKFIRKIIINIILGIIYLYSVFKHQDEPFRKIWDDIKQFKMKEFICVCICLLISLYIGVQYYTDIPSVDTPYSKFDKWKKSLNDNIYIATNKIFFYADKEEKWIKNNPKTVYILNHIFFSNRCKRSRLHKKFLRIKLIEEKLNQKYENSENSKVSYKQSKKNNT